MRYIDDMGLPQRASARELEAMDAAQGRERVPRSVLSSLVAMTAALQLLEGNAETMERTARRAGQWSALRRATGQLRAALERIMATVSARQVLSLRENHRNVLIQVSARPAEQSVNLLEDVAQTLVTYARLGCSVCLSTEAQARRCPLRTALDTIPGLDAERENIGLCPYMYRRE